jgi:hypothetical protein
LSFTIHSSVLGIAIPTLRGLRSISAGGRYVQRLHSVSPYIENTWPMGTSAGSGRCAWSTRLRPYSRRSVHSRSRTALDSATRRESRKIVGTTGEPGDLLVDDALEHFRGICETSAPIRDARPSRKAMIIWYRP